MTPEQEYLAYVRRDIDCGVLNEQGALELVDKLEAAWAYQELLKLDRASAEGDARDQRERALRAEAMAQHHREFSDVYEQQRNAAEAALAVMRDRAEQAEAEVEEIEGRMACLEAVRFNNDAQWQLDLDALARVRALCDQAANHGGTVATYAIRAAIEGDNQ